MKLLTLYIRKMGWLTAVAFGLMLSKAVAQDIHFSQYIYTPVIISPALAGDFEKEIRASMHYRKQWASVGQGYGTQMATGEYNFLPRNRSLNRPAVALQVYSDRGGLARLNTFAAQGTLAYHIQTSRSSVFSAGLTMSYLQRSIRFDGLAWDAQYDGIAYDPTRDNMENFASQSRSVLNASLGLMLKGDGEVPWKVAYGLHNLGQRRSFLMTYRDRLYTRHSAMVAVAHHLPYVMMHYDVLLSRQAGAMEMNLGMRAEYRLGRDSRYTNINTSSAVYAGAFYRVGDALSPLVGFEYERTFSGYISYDIQLSSFNNATNLAGGLEFTFIYTGWVKQRRIKLK